MELDVGKYVRFDKVLCQIEEVEDDRLCFDIGFYDHWNELTYSMKYKEFVEEYKPRFSDNIIDLIEVGDLVNGEKVIRVIPQDICGDEVLDYQHIFVNDKEVFKEDIKSIVTKEQFESMSYKVEE